nr:hypothetical protein [Candidatus Baldrarchaeota archaeon]
MPIKPFFNSCRTAHDFLISLLYSISYTSGPTYYFSKPGSLLELGYVFSTLDIPSIFNISAPDVLLINKAKKIVLAIDCKSDTVDPDNIVRKFGYEFQEAIRVLLRDDAKEFRMEFGVFTFEKYVRDFENIVMQIRSNTTYELFIWYTTERPLFIPDENAQAFFIRKYFSNSFHYNHCDNILDDYLTNGIIIREDQIRCNNLADKDAERPAVFYEVSLFLFQRAIQKPGETIFLGKLIDEIKANYQSPVSRRVLIGVIRDIIEVFPQIAELEEKSMLVKFKKQKLKNFNIEEFQSIRQKVLYMNEKEYYEFIKNLKREKKEKKQAKT